MLAGVQHRCKVSPAVFSGMCVVQSESIVCNNPGRNSQCALLLQPHPRDAVVPVNVDGLDDHRNAL